MYVFRELQGVPRPKQLRKHCLKERREYCKLTEEATARTVCTTGCGPVGRQTAEGNEYVYIYTGCPRRNVPDFGRVFLMLKYTDITQNTYVQS